MSFLELVLQWQGEGAPCCSRSAANTAALPHIRQRPLSPRVPSCVLRVHSVHISAYSAAALSPLSCVFTQVSVSLSGWGWGGRKLGAKYENLSKEKKNCLRNCSKSHWMYKWSTKQQKWYAGLLCVCVFCGYLPFFMCVCVCLLLILAIVSCSFKKCVCTDVLVKHRRCILMWELCWQTCAH